MKKCTLFPVIILLAGLLVFSCGKAPETKEAPITLSYSIFFPATHAQGAAGEAWAKEIEKRTRGRVKINVFAGGTLTKANECYSGVVKGISDIGMSCFAYTRGRFPVMEAADLPLGYPSGRVATYAVNQFYQKMKPEELADVKVLYLHAHGPGLLHSRKPVRNLEDLKGLKIRSTGLSAKVVEALGGSAVAMPQGATYEALQKGVVEGTFGPIETLKGWRQGEVIGYTTDCVDIGYTTTMFVVMNKAKWNALPEDLQKIFDAVSSEWIDVHAAAWDRVDIEGREFTRSLKNEIIALSEDEHKKWVEAVQPVMDDYIKAAQQKGIPGEQTVSELKSQIRRFQEKFNS